MKARMTKTVRSFVVAGAMAGLTACSGDENPELMNLTNPGEGPDEFQVIPNKPLEIPEDYAEAPLPLPQPGGTNLAAPKPEEDVILALGGNPAAAQSANGGLITYASRFGVIQNIRADLAVADLEYRRRNNGRVLERLFNVSVYYEAYEPLALDQYAELERWRAAGVRTPSAPPDPNVIPGQ